MTVTVKVVVPPCVTVAVAGAVTAKSGAVVSPLPASVTTWGLERSVSVKTRVADSAPAADGVNLTPTVQVAPAATVVPQVSDVFAKSVAEAGGVPTTMAMEANVTAVPLLLVTVTVCSALAEATSWPPKFRLDGETTKLGIRLNLATKASVVPFRAGWKAPEEMGNVAADEKTWPVM